MNIPYCGDNLKMLRDYIKGESVDLIYLDSPTGGNATVRERAANRNYNVLFKDESGTEADSRDTRIRGHLALVPTAEEIDL